jgi:hypothetical protein
MVLLIFLLEFIFMIVLNEGELITFKLNDLIMEKFTQPLHYNLRHSLKCIIWQP